MTRLVADTSGLVSLGIAGQDIDSISLCLERYNVAVPETVVEELREVASYDDVHGDGAGRVLGRTDDLSVQAVDLAEFPLDDGENAAVTLANEDDAAILLCDEFDRLGLVHASLADTRLVTTPTLFSVFVRQDRLASTDASALFGPVITGLRPVLRGPLPLSRVGSGAHVLLSVGIQNASLNPGSNPSIARSLLTFVRRRKRAARDLNHAETCSRCCARLVSFKSVDCAFAPHLRSSQKAGGEGFEPPTFWSGTKRSIR